MKKMRAFVIGSVGLSLFAFQNCGGSMEANQEIQNLQNQENERQQVDAPSGAIVPQHMSKLTGSCLASDLKLAWPLQGSQGKEWNNANYIDEDSTTGILDYMGAVGSSAVTYNGHFGTDISVGNFRAMDANTPVLAAAPGTVVNLNAGSFDRNVSCSQDLWNFVAIRHPNGYLTVYGHMKKDSIVVRIGDIVTAGQKLGVVGSSGCSTAPHLHLTVADCTQAPVDPWKLGMFLSPPVYSRQAATGIMDTALFQPILSSTNGINQMKDPGVDVPSVHANQAFSIGAVMANFKPGQILEFQVFDPSGLQKPLGYKINNSLFYSVSYWWANLILPAPGVWHIKFVIAGAVLSERNVTVVP